MCGQSSRDHPVYNHLNHHQHHQHHHNTTVTAYRAVTAEVHAVYFTDAECRFNARLKVSRIYSEKKKEGCILCDKVVPGIRPETRPAPSGQPTRTDALSPGCLKGPYRVVRRGRSSCRGITTDKQSGEEVSNGRSFVRLVAADTDTPADDRYSVVVVVVVVVLSPFVRALIDSDSRDASHTRVCSRAFCPPRLALLYR